MCLILLQLIHQVNQLLDVQSQVPPKSGPKAAKGLLVQTSCGDTVPGQVDKQSLKSTLPPNPIMLNLRSQYVTILHV